VDIGIGTENPIGYAGGRGVDAGAFVRVCRNWNMPGVGFTPYERKEFGGARLSLHLRAAANLTSLDVHLLAELNRQMGGRVLASMSRDKLSLFHKVYGSETLYQQLRQGVSPAAIARAWEPSVAAFRSQRQRHLLYA
jgi:hypothetical protein